MEGVYLKNCPPSTKILPYKLVKTSTQTDPLQETVEIQLNRPRGPSFCLEQLERGQVTLAVFILRTHYPSERTWANIL